MASDPVANSAASRAEVMEGLKEDLHPSLNGGWEMDKIVRKLGVYRPVWWRCPVGPDHHWQETIDARVLDVKNTSCPFCRGEQISLTNIFEVLRPELVAEWHPTKNPPEMGPAKAMNPLSFTPVWWSCSKVPGHEWRARVKDRTRGASCPLCAAAVAAEQLKAEADKKKTAADRVEGTQPISAEKVGAWERRQQRLRERGVGASSRK